MLDFIRFSSDERCCYYPLWFKTWEHSLMHQVSCSSSSFNNWSFLYYILYEFWAYFLPLFLFIVCYQCETSSDQNYWLRISMHGRSHCLLLYPGFYKLACLNIVRLMNTVLNDTFFCRVDTTDHLKFFLDISIQLPLTCGHLDA